MYQHPDLQLIAEGSAINKELLDKKMYYAKFSNRELADKLIKLHNEKRAAWLEYEDKATGEIEITISEIEQVILDRFLEEHGYNVDNTNVF